MNAIPQDLFDHEKVVSLTGPRSGVPITVALHSTVLGPALGGCRMWAYGSWQDSFDDALRLSSAMTLKNAAAGLDAGGGKSVIMLERGSTLNPDRRRAALLDLGEAVQGLGGTYRTAEDVGTTEQDMRIVSEMTEHVLGLPTEAGGSGEPAGPTSKGVYHGIEATLAEVFGSSTVEGRRFTIAGLGQVGTRLAHRLHAGGAILTVSDLNPERRNIAVELGADWVSVNDALEVPADVLVPAGVGGVITPSVIDRLDVRAIVGPANNPLSSRTDSDLLAQRGILYAPDFVVNAGGVIYLTMAADNASAEAIDARLRDIGRTLAQVFLDANATGSTPLASAERLARSRIDARRQ